MCTITNLYICVYELVIKFLLIVMVKTLLKYDPPDVVGRFCFNSLLGAFSTITIFAVSKG